MIKVIFLDNANLSPRVIFRVGFRSLRLAERFDKEWKHMGGCLRFHMDIHGETNEELPIIPCNGRGFRIVYDALYGVPNGI